MTTKVRNQTTKLSLLFLGIMMFLIPFISASILNLDNLDSIFVYENTDNSYLYIFNKTDSRLVNDINEGVYSYDFNTIDNEHYDVYISDVDGNLDEDGKFITIESFRNDFLTNKNTGGNINSVGLNFNGDIVYADVITNVNLGYGLSGEYIDGFANNALGAPYGEPTDKSGNGNHGVLNGDAQIINNELVLDGNGDYIKTSDSISLENNFSVGVWVKPESHSESWSRIIGYWSDFELANFDGHLGYLFQYSDGSETDWQHLPQFTIPDNEWTYITIVSYENRFEIYKNGEFIYSKDTCNCNKGLKIDDYELYIGSTRQEIPEEFFDGSIDEVKIWSKSLTPYEIKKEYKNSKRAKDSILYYDLTGNYDSGKIEDKSVYENDGTFYGDAKIVNNELILDGEGDYVWVARHPSINSEFSEQTIMAWVKVDDVSDFKIFGPSGSSYYLHIENNKFGYNTNGCRNGNKCDTDGWETVLSTTTPQEGEWYHVAGVFNGNEMSIYVNGVKENSILVSRNIFDSTNWDVTIGAFPDVENQPYYFHGAIKEIKAWNYALKDSEIQAEYNPTKNEEDLFLYYDFNGDSTYLGDQYSSITVGFLSLFPPECFANSECGTDEYIGDEYCKNDNVYQDYETFTCVSPGTARSYCKSDIEKREVKNCNYGCNYGECKLKKNKGRSYEPSEDSYILDERGYLTEITGNYQTPVVKLTQEDSKPKEVSLNIFVIFLISLIILILILIILVGLIR